MMVSVETWMRQFGRRLGRRLREPGIRFGMKLGLLWSCGFFFSAAGLRKTALPLSMGLICAFPGWQGAVMALGSGLGYPFFWGQAGLQGMVWSLWGLTLARIKADNPQSAVLRCVFGAFLVSVTGLCFQIWLGDETTLSRYLLRIALGAAACGFFPYALGRRDSLLLWVLEGVGVLALAGVTPIPGLDLGCAAGAMVAVSGAFPAAALAGLGLDLAQATSLPMGPVLCLAYFARLNPVRSKWIRYGAPGAAALAVMALCGIWDGSVLPGLVLGGALGLLLPPKPELQHRRGETGLAQVRLEVTAGMMSQLQHLLLEVPAVPLDEEALLNRAIQSACGSCSARSACLDRQRLTVAMVRDPNLFQCRKPGRIRQELHRSREQEKQLRADRQRQAQYRWALIQQYQFLSDYLRNLADRLAQRGEPLPVRYRAQVSARSRAREEANGDRCLAFSGSGCKYYVLLCDGMGTGLGAAEEARTAAQLLKRMLAAGFPGDHAFRSLNSLLALRGQAGAVTLDLAELRLDSGRVTLYKWGAAPSLLLGKKGIEKAGTATLPPGLSVTEGREEVIRLSLRRGETLVLLSDGVELGEKLCLERMASELPPGELAERILEKASGEDDATVVVIRLCPGSLGQ